MIIIGIVGTILPRNIFHIFTCFFFFIIDFKQSVNKISFQLDPDDWFPFFIIINFVFYFGHQNDWWFKLNTLLS